MLWRLFPLSLSAAVALAAAPPAVAGPAEDARAIRAGLDRAVAAGKLTRAEAREHRTIVARVRAELRLLPGSRQAALARVLTLVRLQAPRYTRPRARALFSMLELNGDYLAVRAVPRNETDVVAPDGIVYRAGWSAGLQFHPLANVIALNAHLYAGRNTQAARLAEALRARAVSRPGGAAWEYYFPYAGGAPPWTSGMAQAVGAQALARAGEQLENPALAAPARRAFGVIPGRLAFRVATGPWIRLYSFNDLAALNAQLQAVLSLSDYARMTGDEQAGGLAARLEASAVGLIPRFDTGHWTNYSPGRESPLKYHLYHVDLAALLAARTRDGFWQEAYGRFHRYTSEPPAFEPGKAIPTLYPWPADGFRDEARIGFWVSKISTVTLRIGGEARSLGLRRRGWHSVTWRPGRRAPGTVTPVVTAVDLAGNRGEAPLRPITIAVDRTPPDVTASVAGPRLSWRVRDDATPWVTMTLRLERNGVRKTLDLGRRPLRGSLRLSLPRGRWDALLVVRDSTGNRARADLGKIPVPR